MDSLITTDELIMPIIEIIMIIGAIAFNKSVFDKIAMEQEFNGAEWALFNGLLLNPIWSIIITFLAYRKIKTLTYTAYEDFARAEFRAALKVYAVCAVIKIAAYAIIWNYLSEM